MEEVGKKTLDQFIESYSAVKVLESNLRCNLDAMTELETSEKEDLMRVNMIMVRQCLNDFGVE